MDSKERSHHLFEDVRALSAADDHDHWPTVEELGAIFPDWAVEGTSHRGRRSLTQDMCHRTTGASATVILTRRMKAARWEGHKPPAQPSHVVTILEWGMAGEDAYILYERAEGVTLAESIDTGQVSRKMMVEKISPQIDAALNAAHELALELDTRPEMILYDVERQDVTLRPLQDEAALKVSGDWLEEHIGVGARIGPYYLTGLLGQGGFAEVYRAEQRDPIRREVALKILKLGMDSEEVLARFKAERQALARLHHPHIASIYDAGTTKQGRPYFVMELVPGETLTNYAETKGLGLHDKLVLFQKLCQAVKHAHDLGIIHRDLKPGNILVLEDDEGRPVPKVIDFGIAKATQQPLTEQTLHTRFYHLLGSLSYMSPEQASMDRRVDGRTDVYALGCLLYELLTDRTPLGRNTTELAPIDALALIRDDLPPSPSQAAPMGKRISRDLDAVVMKALEKDCARRYGAVGDLLEDIERVLAGEAVSVRSPGIRYRVKRCWRDRRVKSACFASVGAMLALLVVSLWPEQPPPPPEPIDFVAQSRTADGKVLPVGLWQFDGNLENTLPGGAPMRLIGQPMVEFQEAEIGGAVANVLSFPNFKVDEYLTVDNAIPPNGWEFAEDTNVYTLVMDVMFPELPRAASLMQASVGNSGGAEFVFDEGGRPWSSRRGRGQGRISPGSWHRLAFTAGVRGQTELVRIWIDGQAATNVQPDGLVDSHIGLNEEIHFFADGKGATCAGFVNSIALYDVILTDAEIVSLGKATVEGIPSAIDAVSGQSLLPEAVGLASAVVLPPEPGYQLPLPGPQASYHVGCGDDALLVSKATVGGRSRGGAWIYRASGATWTLTTSLMPPKATEDHWAFGKYATSLGDWAAVAAPAEPVRGEGGAGAVYLYHQAVNGSWDFHTRIESPHPELRLHFGDYLHLGPGILLVGESGLSENPAKQGRVHLFEYREKTAENAGWIRTATIERPDETVGRMAAIADRKTVFLRTGFGRFSLYEKLNGKWRQKYEFQREGDVSYLGNAMACDGETLLVSWAKQKGGKGEVLVFRRNEGGADAWGFAGSIPAPLTALTPRRFGSKVAVDGDRVVVSCLSEDKRTVSFHQFSQGENGNLNWQETVKPLTIPDVNGHALSGLRAAATTSHEGGQVLVYDLVDWANQHPVSAITQRQTLIGSGSGPGAHFGYGMAKQGDWLMVGADGEMTDGKKDFGVAYVFRREPNGEWIETQRLQPSDRAVVGDARFGNSVALDGPFAVIGSSNAPHDGRSAVGAAYVFYQDPQTGGWVEVAKLEPMPPVSGASFGGSVSISGSTIAVGAAYEESGVCYIYERGPNGPGDWSLVTRLTSHTPSKKMHFGVSVALKGNRLVVGARHVGGVGHVELFDRSPPGGEWKRVAVAKHPRKVRNVQFGYQVDFEGDLVAVGTPNETVQGIPAAGKVYLYEKNPEGLKLIQTLASPEPEGHGRFTFARLFGDLLFVGERGHAKHPGACYVFKRESEQWGLLHTIESSDPGDFNFGRQVAYDGTSLLISESHGGPEQSGCVHVYDYLIPTVASKQVLRGTQSGSRSAFGYCLAMEGDEAIIGAWGSEGGGSVREVGAAYVYREDALGYWKVGQPLVPADIQELGQARYGGELAIDDGTVVVSARYATVDGHSQAGAAYVFSREVDGHWQETAKLTSDRPREAATFSKCDIDGDTIVVGSPKESSGVVYLYDRDANTGEWRLSQRLNGGRGLTYFGGRVRLDGNRLLVSAMFWSSNRGYVALYERTRFGDEWALATRFEAPDGKAGDKFGYSIDIEGGRIAVGALERSRGEEQKQVGGIYLFEETPGGWEFRQCVGRPALREGLHFSICRLDGDRLYVGDQGGSNVSGACYLFERTPGDEPSWRLRQVFPGSAGGGSTVKSIGFTEDSLLIGEYLRSKESHVHVFKID